MARTPPGAVRDASTRRLPPHLTHVAFILALDFVRDGVDGWLERGWLLTVIEWAVFAGGVVLSRQAVIRGRAHANKQAEQAQQQAAAKTDEYAEFLREAERAGEKIAQRDAAKAEAQAPAQAPPAPEQAQALAPAAPAA